MALLIAAMFCGCAGERFFFENRPLHEPPLLKIMLLKPLLQIRRTHLPSKCSTLTVRLRICRTSPASPTFHLDRDYDHPIYCNQLIVPSFNLTTVGRRAFPVSAANLWKASLHTSSQHRRSRFSRSVSRLFFSSVPTPTF